MENITKLLETNMDTDIYAERDAGVSQQLY